MKIKVVFGILRIIPAMFIYEYENGLMDYEDSEASEGYFSEISEFSDVETVSANDDGYETDNDPFGLDIAVRGDKDANYRHLQMIFGKNAICVDRSPLWDAEVQAYAYAAEGKA